ncbi:acyl-CoA dehydrogenase family protein [Modestobacter roseus]|uniref:Acyl-CoA dehydrogenase-like protein n=1 Tax=Modestobacter roseus TaxID=1181884 RepID=A0A562IMX5_9ACTN|nr:acyl-CoA dehydrogenase family protein [Modestobacter roseus]MQA32368.1 acyl-CoA dehydrogenase [Modestobacter roseus]TWH72367.1 acyl-CoA dehydrogenase-like protein [Modestobacter roseus]
MITSGTGADDPVARTASSFRSLLEAGWSPPLPGAGATLDRWRQLAALAERDLPLARLAEGHADAVAVLAELGEPETPHGARLGVWAAEPPDGRVAATPTDDGGWQLTGRKRWCSGAGVLTAALVTATADDGRRLFLLDLDHPGVRVDPTAWVGAGMAGSDTADVHLHDVPVRPVGGPGAYLARPGFWHGGIGVAAVWAGGARGVAAALVAAAVRRGPDPLRDAAVGAVDVLLAGVDAALRGAAAEVDADPLDRAGTAQLRAQRLRALAARAGEEVLGTVGRALGAAPLAHDAEHAARVADLTVYLRQHHGERDLAALGALVRERAAR